MVGLTYLVTLGAVVGAAVAASVVLVLAVLAVGPETGRARYAVAAGVVVLLGGVLVPELILGVTELGSGVRIVGAVLAGVVVATIGIPLAERLTLDA